MEPRSYEKKPDNEKYEVEPILDFLKSVRSSYFVDCEEIESVIVKTLNKISSETGSSSVYILKTTRNYQKVKVQCSDPKC